MKNTLILGGARSGKSRYAEQVVRQQPGPWVYIATAYAGDEEMAARIARHRADRGADWITIEEQRDLPAALQQAAHRNAGAVLVDCLTLWLSNLMLAEVDHEDAAEALRAMLPDMPMPIVFVSNEVGMGLVPETELGRAFRDAQGRLNQTMAEAVDRVEFIAAGLPLRLKG